MASLSLKVLLCLVLAAVALAADEDSGQYNPDIYEKPYEQAETEETITEATEEAEEPVEPTEAETETPTPEAPAPATLPEVVAAAPPAVAPFPYPLLYAHQYTPLVYSSPHFLRSPLFPVVL